MDPHGDDCSGLDLWYLNVFFFFISMARRRQSAQSKELSSRLLSISLSLLGHTSSATFPQSPKQNPKLQLRLHPDAGRRRSGAAPLSGFVTCVVACSTPPFQGHTRLRPERLWRRHTSGDEPGPLYTPPTPPAPPAPAPAALMYWSCLLPVNASPCVGPGGARAKLSHDPPTARF